MWELVLDAVSERDKMTKRLIRNIVIGIMTLTLICSSVIYVDAQTTDNGAVVYVSDNEATFDPGGATYSRIICLKHSGTSNGKLLCTFDQLKNVSVQLSDGSTVSKQVYPIYESSDDGTTWSLISNVYDQEYGLPRTSQPCLFELPQQVGDMPAGTILLAGNIFDDDPYTQSRIVLYRSFDGGHTWSFLSQVDQGGPCVYDPSTTSTTTTIWEPFLGISADGRLVCYYSDERQKSSGALQTVSLRASSDGVNWGEEKNVAAITNNSDRPGMITVTELPNGKYMATYEVVNRPSISLNNAVVYCKFSDDGINWDAGSLGTRVALADGRGIGSSPYVKWVDAGGPNGMVIISAKWATDEDDNISGGQNFYVNYNLGEGTWERLPMAVTYDYNDQAGGYFSGFSQSFDVNEDSTILYQATNVENFDNQKVMNGTTYNLNDIRVGTISLDSNLYEAENAALNNVNVEMAVDASGGQEVRYINESDSTVDFDNVIVDTTGNYVINVRYSNGDTHEASHLVKINGSTIGTVNYPVTSNWDRYQWASFTTGLYSGANSIEFDKNVYYAEIDCITVSKVSNAVALVNKNSEKYLEIKSALLSDGAEAGQWGITHNACQNWIFEEVEAGYYRIKNLNSGLYLDIENHSLEDGAKAIQATYSNNYSQQWKLEEASEGYFHIVNRNSGKYLEVQSNSQEDGAVVGQWGMTGYGCQEWTIKLEGTL